MPPAVGNQFGFAIAASCDGSSAKRDGNGLLDGWPGAQITQRNETALFWQDISGNVAGNLIESAFPNSGATVSDCLGIPPALTTAPGTSYVGDYFPAAKIGHGNFIYVYDASGYNWYGLSAVTSVATNGVLYSTAAIPVVQAYNIDKKVDDGLPTTGAVQISYINNNAAAGTQSSSPSAASDSTTTCYNTTSNVYSISSLANYGARGNCALSFRFQ